MEPEPAVLEERRPSASSRGRARPRRGSPRRLAVPGGFALTIFYWRGKLVKTISSEQVGESLVVLTIV